MNQANILIVIADQWRAQSLGYAHNPEVKTPHIDAFAAASCNLSHAISSCPVCTPTRASLLTGLYPDKHGLFLNDAPLNPALPSFGKQFKEMGYDTAWVGKWHVDGHHRYGHIPEERRHGFDYWKTLECTHDYWHSRYYDNESEDISIWDGYDADKQTDDVIAWLKNRDGTKPFCAALSWGPPHSPYQTAPEKYKAMYDPAALTLPPNVPAETEEQAREALAGYYAHCSALDDYFARLMTSMDELKLRDNTIIIFTSDHGDFVGAHGLFDKQGPWDESIRIPFLIGGPDIPAGENKSIINPTDIWPTVAGLIGVQPNAEVQGRDWSQTIRSGTVPENNYALWACYHNFGNWQRFDDKVEELYRSRNGRGIRDERYLYVEDHNGPWLLYDNQEDPYQLNNLIASNHPEEERLAAVLKTELTRLGDGFKPGMEYVNEWAYEVDERGTIACPGWNG